MKYRKREKWCKFSKRSVVAATLLWVVALLCFLKEETDWTLTIAQSRAVNRPCILLNFFDYHDLWHMASALASLVLLVGVSSLDDDLCAIPTRELSRLKVSPHIRAKVHLLSAQRAAYNYSTVFSSL
ncbi:hypothetical protein OESDEN_25628 [Oesophagostomum dentatum]|uniref:Uncharacterized protein n=1 Tax=Oesophagostomum dentatum TaxID=61180 RepID=A0A0B1RSY2_OESDE|nr:hypothetical protein OESDEN_25628 [Oesophagostomum dentatum]